MEAQDQQEENMFFSGTTARKSYIIHIKEAVYIKIQITQKRECFFLSSASSEKDFFYLNKIKETHEIQAKGIQ